MGRLHLGGVQERFWLQTMVENLDNKLTWPSRLQCLKMIGLGIIVCGIWLLCEVQVSMCIMVIFFNTH